LKGQSAIAIVRKHDALQRGGEERNMLVPTNIEIGLGVTFFVLLMLLLRNLMRGRPTGFVAACSVVLGMFLTYQLALGLSDRYERARNPRQEHAGNPQVKVWAEMRTGLYHCPGDASWGKTAQGKYMTQSDALVEAFRPAHHQACE
jgi:hypothetical protein